MGGEHVIDIKSSCRAGEHKCEEPELLSGGGVISITLGGRSRLTDEQKESAHANAAVRDDGAPG